MGVRFPYLPLRNSNGIPIRKELPCSTFTTPTCSLPPTVFRIASGTTGTTHLGRTCWRRVPPWTTDCGMCSLPSCRTVTNSSVRYAGKQTATNTTMSPAVLLKRTGPERFSDHEADYPIPQFPNLHRYLKGKTNAKRSCSPYPC